jgi:Mrp family chromosome partitioning ATPase
VEMIGQERKVRERMNKIRLNIAVIGGKGCVGRGTVTVNLAMASAMHGLVNHVWYVGRGYLRTKCA